MTRRELLTWCVSGVLTGGFAAGWWYHLGCAALVGVLTLRLNPAGYGAAYAAASAEPATGAGCSQ